MEKAKQITAEPAFKGRPGPLPEGSSLFRTLADTISAAIFIYQGAKFRYVNQAAEVLTGFSREELLQKNFWDVVHPDFREIVRERGLARQQEAAVPSRYEFKICTKSGNERWVDFTATHIHFEGEGAALGTVFDITDRKLAEEVQQRAHRTAEALRTAGLALTQELELETVLETLLDHLQRLIPYHSANIMLLENESRISIRASRGYSSAERVREIAFETTGNAIFRRLAETHRGVVVPDTTQEPNWQRTLEGAHVRSWLGVPLVAGGRLIGLYSADQAEPNAFTPEHLYLAEALAGPAAIAIQNARLYEQEQAYVRQLEQRDEERRRAEEALRHSESKFRALTETAASAIFMSQGTRIVYANRETEAITGYSRDELLGRDFWTLIHPDDQPMVKERREARMRGEPVPSRYEFRICTKSGAERTVDFTASLVDWVGTPAVMGTCFDITERKHAEKVQSAIYRISEAANSARNLEELFRSVHNVVGELMPAQNFYIALHDPAENLLTFPYFVDEADPTPAAKKPGRGLTEYVLRTAKPLLASPEVFEGLVQKKEVELIGAPSIDWLGVPLLTPERAIGVLVLQSYTEGVRFTEEQRNILQFVSTQVAMAVERKRTEEALRTSEERYRELVENANDIIYTHDLEGRFTSVNAAGERVTGYSLEEIREMTLSQILSRDQQHFAQEMLDRMLAGEPRAAHEIEIAAKDGRKITLDVSTRLIVQDGKPVGVQGIGRDVSDRKQLEDQLRQAQKMEAVGRLAGGIAHDFNNLLGVMMGYSELLLGRIEPGSPMRKSVEEISKATDRAAKLTKQLLAFSRKQVLAPRVLELNAVLADMESLLRRVIREDVELRVRGGERLGRVKADPGQIEQVILNLALNARDAMPQGGKLTIETANVDLGEVYHRRRPIVPPGRYVMLAVSDTGVGMDAHTQAHVFEPFFTTKEKGKGTGLGLATVYGIVKQSGGFIWVYSEVGAGATFKLYLPRVEAAAPAPVLRPAPAERGHETILLVEDEDGVREVAREFLESSGYTVIESSNPIDAIRITEHYPEEIHLLLSDVVMPEMGGRELSERLLKMRPGLKVMFMSGYTDDAIVHHGVIDANVAFLQKPFARESLERKVRETLEGKTGR